MPESYSHTFSGADLFDLRRLVSAHGKRLWFVYLWQRNGQTLYVNRTRDPITRLTSSKVIGVREALEPNDSILLLGFESRTDAIAYEKKTLLHNSPVYNSLIPIRRRKSSLLPSERAFTPRNLSRLNANTKLPQSSGESPLPLPGTGVERTPESEA